MQKIKVPLVGKGLILFKLREEMLSLAMGVAGVVCVHQELSLEESESAQPTADPRSLAETEDHTTT